MELKLRCFSRDYSTSFLFIGKNARDIVYMTFIESAEYHLSRTQCNQRLISSSKSTEVNRDNIQFVRRISQEINLAVFALPFAAKSSHFSICHVYKFSVRNKPLVRFHVTF